ncbi:double strand RNA binding from dead end protein 1 domain-protein [Podospora conica]|nr:double strand RNA binding from dead end protein 1 domain-protein [Schizothecium conicum]
MSGFYMQYLESLCRRRGWHDPSYECYRGSNGYYTCLVLVNGREYQTDLAYESGGLAQENAAMRAFMVCRNFSVNGGMLARNGIVQGLPADDTSRRRKSRHHSSSTHSHGSSRRSGNHSSSSSTASLE